MLRERLKLYRPVESGRDFHAVEPALPRCFQPDWLPDPGGARVEDAARFRLPVLLAAGDVAIRWRVFGTDRDLVGAILQQHRRDVESERNIAPLMIACNSPVHPD